MADLIPCLFCGGDRAAPDHWRTCDGKQGALEALEALAYELPPVPPRPDFDGATYERARDQDRLHAQLSRVKLAMADACWHQLAELARATGDPEASISARLRDLRKEKFGGYHVERRYVASGLWEYRIPPAA